MFGRKKKSPADAFLDRLENLFDYEGKTAYLGEDVSIANHMLQTALVAKRANAPPHLIAAALLHDIGYFARVRNVVTGAHLTHEQAGAEFLLPYFSEAVTEPIRLHVFAKRYLVTVQHEYIEVLSEASRQTLELQGGTLSREEITQFEANPHHEDALQIRRWDDSGEDKDARRILAFVQFRPLLSQLLS